MCELKVGQRVIRIENGNPAFKAGETGTVVAHQRGMNRFIVVRKDKDGTDEYNLRPEFFAPLNPQAEAYVAEARDNTYRFKVGDKGKTRNGHNYRVIADDYKGNFSGQTILALIDDGSGGRETPVARYTDGRLTREKELGNDLMPPTRTVYVNLYDNGDAFHHEEEAKAKKMAGKGRCFAVAVPVEVRG